MSNPGGATVDRPQEAADSTGRHVVVVGAGLSGLTAALRLSAAGARVTVLSAVPSPVAASTPNLEPGSQTMVDNGQHVFLRCCDRFVALLDKLGIAANTRLQERLSVRVYDRDGRWSTLSAQRLPPPLHLLLSLTTYRHLSLLEKLRAAVALLKIGRTSDRKRRALDGVPFGAWLRRNGQSDRAIRNLWDLIATPTLNERAEDASCAMAFKVFRTALLEGRRNADLGYATVPLDELVAPAALSRIEASGGRVVLGTAVQEISARDGRVQVAAGETYEADAVVVAVPFQSLPQFAPEIGLGGVVEAASGLHTSPIVNVHLWLDRPVLDVEFAAVLDSPLQFVFNRDLMMSRRDWTGHYLDVSISAAHDCVGLPNDEVLRIVVDELRHVFSSARDAMVLKSAVVRQRHATLSPAPGSLALRPPMGATFGNVVLAGDWLDTDWPGTMEGAVRSGEAAGAAVIARLAIPAAPPL
ncbi:MAG: FAD-dependent oxidoreductase [Dehalococcoidia bacterium]|nr:FAD-dependent oxidoreductase [Dehalococcoidia bacterium]